MKDKLDKALAASKKFCSDHKVGIAVTVTAVATAIAVGKLQSSYLKDMQEFIESKGLTDEFIDHLPNHES